MSKHKFLYLDCLRGFAAVAVVLYHVTENNGLHWLPSADIAVDLFFGLSGFVMAASYSQAIGQGLDFKTFIVRRLIRLYPMFLVGLLLGAAAIYIKHDLALSDISPDRLATIFYTNALFIPYFGSASTHVFNYVSHDEGFPLSPSHWSLFFEIVAYAIFFFVSRRKPKLVPVLAVAGWVLFFGVSLRWGTGLGWGHGIFFWGGLPRVVYGFFAGVVAFIVYSNDRSAAFSAARQFIAKHSRLVALLLISALILDFSWAPAKTAVAHILVVSASPLLVLIGACVRVENGALNSACRILGFLSYPLYCIHYPILEFADVAARHPLRDTSPLALSCGVTALSIILAIVFAKFIDEPVRRILTRKFGADRVMKPATVTTAVANGQKQ